MPGKIGLIALESAKKMGSRIDRILSEWRNGEHFLITPECPRFSSGEGKCVLVSVQSCGQNRYRGGYPYPPRTPRAKNGVRGRETPSPSPEPRRRRLLSCVQAAPPAGCEPLTDPAGTVRGVVPLHSSPERHRDRVPDRALHEA